MYKRQKRDKAHAPGAVSDELGPLGVVTNRIGHASGRRLSKEVHKNGRSKNPAGTQIIDLHILEEFDSKKGRAKGAIRTDPRLTAKKTDEDS